MKNLTKIVLTAITGSSLLLFGAQAASAAPGSQSPGDPQTRMEKKDGQRQPSSAPAGAKTDQKLKGDPRQSSPAPGRNDTGQKMKGDQRQPSSVPGGVKTDRKAPDGPGQARPNETGPNRKSSNFNKWDKGRVEQNQNSRSKPGRPAGQAAHPQSSGLTHDQAWKMAREHKLTGYKALPEKDRRELVMGRALPSRLGPRPVPEPMRKRLPAHSGYEWRIVGRDLVLVAAGTLIVHEIIQNVFN